MHNNPLEVRQGGCAACHILFSLVDRMQICYLRSSQPWNDSFIEMIEDIHMRQRNMAITFALKNRNTKDRHINSNFENFLEELSCDLKNYGHDLVLRKVMISAIAIEIAQNIGIDYHAATEELYYYMRKNDERTSALLLEFTISDSIKT